MEEESKAVQEIAKTTGKAIDAASKLGGFLSKVLGEPFLELGEAFHDWAKFYRYENLLKIQDKVNEIHQKRKIEGKTIPIPPRYAIPLIQSASQENETSLQMMWARLIANATDPGKKIDIKKIYIEILSALEPIDVLILDRLSKAGITIKKEKGGEEHRIYGINKKELINHTHLSNKEIELSLQNLNRLGLVTDHFEPTWKDLGSMSFGNRIMDSRTTFTPSPLGYSLIEACNDQ